MNRSHVILAALAVVLCLAGPAFADSGLALMLLPLVRTTGRMLLVSVAEAAIIQWLFRPRARWMVTFGIMLLANGTSTLTGVTFFRHVFASLGETLTNGAGFCYLGWVFVLLFMISWAVTLVIEWPFCYWAVGRREHRAADSIWADVAAQSLSYPILLALILTAGDLTLLTKVQRTQDLVPQAPNIATVYFLSNSDDGLWSVRLNGTGLRKVKDLPASQAHDALALFAARRKAAKTWDLYTRDAGGIHLALEGFASAGVMSTGREIAPGFEEGNWHGVPAAALSPSRPSLWCLQIESDDVDGLSIYNTKTQHRTVLAMDALLMRWPIRCASRLPNELTVLQVGRKIVLLDPATREMGLIAPGSSPVVVVDEAVARQAAAQAATAAVASAASGPATQAAPPTASAPARAASSRPKAATMPATAASIPTTEEIFEVRERRYPPDVARYLVSGTELTATGVLDSLAARIAQRAGKCRIKVVFTDKRESEDGKTLLAGLARLAKEYGCAIDYSSPRSSYDGETTILWSDTTFTPG